MPERDEMLERMVRMETKLDFIIQDRERLDKAEKTAQEALALSQENARDIAEMKSTAKWLWGIVLTTVGSLIVGLILFFATK
jgi:dimeric dUTPase (all-alpha-NTP-PPase superfamily)